MLIHKKLIYNFIIILNTKIINEKILLKYVRVTSN